MSESAPALARPSKPPRHGQEAPVVPDEVIVEQILVRVPAAATVRFQAVCRAWRDALASDHFVQAYEAVRAAATKPPEIVFFAPTAAGSTAFYSSRLNDPTTHEKNGSSPAAARELVTVGNLRARDVVLSGTKPCRGLTLLFQPRENVYHVCNLSTGEHVSLPPCSPAWREITDGPYVLSSAGLGFVPAAGEHVVVRLFEDLSKRQQRCEVFGLRSGGGWRPCAGQAPPHSAKGLDGCPPVFLDGRFYWYIDSSRTNPAAGLHQQQEEAITPERILSLSVATEEFEWVPAPEERARNVLRLVELDGALCAVVDARLSMELFELWTRTGPASWSLSIRISLATLPQPARSDLGRGIRMLPLGTSSSGYGRKTILLLGTSRNQVYAYDPRSNTAGRVFSVEDFVDDAPGEGGLMLSVALHEESVASVRHRAAAAGTLEMKLGSSTVARRRGAAAGGQRRNDDLDITPQLIQQMLGAAMDQFHNIINMYYYD
ncbi:unnamed protein product [Urochloa decumbens]|uniref:F-box associated beta-propeller type 3 domain-containing protein n=1 Tax=Urochloa decumbens TaxID=240449 RepID=A0ABC9ELB3_9POAL